MDFKIINADVFTGLEMLEAESVDMVITSPPYWGLRDYGIDGQIGLEEHPQEYLNKIADVFDEVKRVLKKSGSLWLNLGDTYYNAGTPGEHTEEKRSKNWQPSYPKKPKCKSNYLQPKQLMLMPHRVAIALQERGWILRNTVVWHKPNAMPSSVKDRLTNSYDFLFHFVKRRKYFYDLDAIREPHSTEGYTPFNLRVRDVKVGRIASHQYKASKEELDQYSEEGITQNPSGKNPADVWKYENKEQEAKHRQGLFRGRENEVVEVRPLLPSQKEFVDKLRKKFTIEKIIKKTGLPKTTVEHWFRYDESGFAFPSKEDWEKLGIDLFKKELTTVELKPAYVEASEFGKNPSDFWTIPTQPFSEAHFAVFPERLLEKPFKATVPKQICVKCGKIRERILKPSEEYAKVINESRNSPAWKKERRYDVKKIGNALGAKPARITASFETVGFSDCGCNAGFHAGVVLDPFLGSGTTLIVAKKFKVSGIGIDISKKYCKMAYDRLTERLKHKKGQAYLSEPSNIELVKVKRK